MHFGNKQHSWLRLLLSKYKSVHFVLYAIHLFAMDYMLFYYEIFNTYPDNNLPQNIDYKFCILSKVTK